MIAQKSIDAIRQIIGDEERTQAVLLIIEEMENDRKQQNHRRQADGIPRMQFPKNFDGIYNCYKSKAITATHAAEVLGVNRNSFRELVRRYEAEEQLQK